MLSVSRLSPEKGVLMLVEAFAGLKELLPNAVLDIVGEGPERDRIEGRIEELKLTGWCELEGCNCRAGLDS